MSVFPCYGSVNSLLYKRRRETLTQQTAGHNRGLRRNASSELAELLIIGHHCPDINWARLRR